MPLKDVLQFATCTAGGLERRLLLGVGDGGASTSGGTQKPAKQEHDPLSCLRGAGLSDVVKRDRDLWRGFSDQGVVIRVNSFASRAKARNAAKAADLVTSEHAGEYAVFGPRQDDGLTARVARCLRGS